MVAKTLELSILSFLVPSNILASPPGPWKIVTPKVTHPSILGAHKLAEAKVRSVAAFGGGFTLLLLL